MDRKKAFVAETATEMFVQAIAIGNNPSPKQMSALAGDCIHAAAILYDTLVTCNYVEP